MDSSELAVLFEGAREGDLGAKKALMATVHQELWLLARLAMFDEVPHGPLQPVFLVNEAWLRLFGHGEGSEHRRHFFGVAARAMRQVLVERAQGYGARRERVSLGSVEVKAPAGMDFGVFQLEEALSELESFQPRLARLVELRYLAGLGLQETAATLGVSVATVKRDWSYVRGWLLGHLSH